MVNIETVCMSCMKDIGELKQCPHCGYHVDSPQVPPYLPVRCVIANRYIVGKLFENNGDGATYIAWDIQQHTPVKLREFFPDAIAVRAVGELGVAVMPGCERTYDDCYQSFLELWRKLMRLQGLTALIHVRDIVEQNNTAYAVFAHVEGVSLREYLLLKSKTGYITWDRARQLLMPLLSTIGTLHASGIVHRGISPTTLMVGADGKVWLSGFSIWQARTARGDLTAQLFPGYAAYEQYGYEGQQGPWTDIYAFAGVLYRALIGSDPIEVTLRVANDRLMVPGAFAEQLPAYVIHALVNAMQIMPENRTRTVEQLRAELSASPSAAVAGENYHAAEQQEARPREDEQALAAARKKMAMRTTLKTALIIIAAGLILLAALLFTVWRDYLPFLPPEEPDTQQTLGTAEATLEEVPDFVSAGFAYDDIISNPVFNTIFKYEKKEAYSDTVSKGYVIAQDVKSGTKLEHGSTIVLTVSLGKQMLTFPSGLEGKPFTEVEKQLKDMGFQVKGLPRSNDGANEAGVVIALSLTAGTQYEKGTEVAIQYWEEPPTQESTEPTQEPDTRSLYDQIFN